MIIIIRSRIHGPIRSRVRDHATIDRSIVIFIAASLINVKRTRCCISVRHVAIVHISIMTSVRIRNLI